MTETGADEVQMLVINTKVKYTMTNKRLHIVEYRHSLAVVPYNKLGKARKPTLQVALAGFEMSDWFSYFIMCPVLALHTNQE